MSGETCANLGCNREPLDRWPGGYCRNCYEMLQARVARRRIGGEAVKARERQIPERRWEGRMERDLRRWESNYDEPDEE